MSPRQLIEEQFHHFNSGELKRAAEAYVRFLREENGKMFLVIAGAMSTARLGISIAEMIRRDKIHAICCTGANLEEDVYRLIGHSSYGWSLDWRDLTNEDEQQLLERDLPRVTDALIPEKKTMTPLGKLLRQRWEAAEKAGERKFPQEFLFDCLNELRPYDYPEKDSWILAAREAKIPIFVPGWEDSTSGNLFAGEVIKKNRDPLTVKCGTEVMVDLANWFRAETAKNPVGFFQIGGGIAGDFSICVSPMLRYDAEEADTPFWSYFAQISDSVTSFGSYSGALPREKITWGKLEPDTPMFMIESDATIVAPLIFSYVLDEKSG